MPPDMGGQRSSFRSFSCATLPALDQFHRRKLMAEGAEEFDSPATRSSPSSSAAAAIETSGGADNDSGIVPDSPYIRHYQPCQLLSSWRCRPQPKVRRSLSPIFQRRENDHHSDENSGRNFSNSSNYSLCFLDASMRCVSNSIQYRLTLRMRKSCRAMRPFGPAHQLRRTGRAHRALQCNLVPKEFP